MNREEGAASLVMVGVIAFAVMACAGLAMVAAILRTRIEANTAADAAALAAAPVTFLPFGAAGTPAQEAGRFARANGARLLSCSCPVDESWEARTAVVVVEKSVVLGPLGSVGVRATSRAEFAPAQLLEAVAAGE